MGIVFREMSGASIFVSMFLKVIKRDQMDVKLGLFPPGIEPRAVEWQSITQLLRHASSYFIHNWHDK